jgi:3-oxoacyl-[acyl-carrier-protein] synthase III
VRDVFITGTGSVLPGDPIGFEAMEAHLGLIGGRPSALGPRALRWNGIGTRHYAVTPDGRATHSNAGMCAEAVGEALDAAGRSAGALSLLTAATTQGDLLVPGHASMVHGELSARRGVGALEVGSFQSVCASSLMAAKAAWLGVASGEHAPAAACAGEFSSRWFRPQFYEGTDLIDAKGRLRLEAEFLRWTLSDGAGAVLMEPAPRRGALNLRVDSVRLTSLADRFDPCMWAGATEADRHAPEAGWALPGPVRAHAEGRIALLQDFVLLKRMIRAWVGVWLEHVEHGRLVPDAVDHLLCHYSAKSLREEIVSLLEKTGGMIPETKWFTNLPTCGNTGSASIWIMLDGLLRTGRVKDGERILCVVPESGRGMVGFMQLTAVAG